MQRPKYALALLLTGLALTPVPLAAQGDVGRLGEDRPGDEGAVHAALNAMHQAASDAAFDPYVGAFTDDGVFLGTDPDERWPIAEFAEFARPYFERGQGWTYVPTQRWVTIAESGETAWFDERLDNASYGDTRGSGVLVRVDGRWRIAQYNLTIPIPNELAREFVDRIRSTGGG